MRLPGGRRGRCSRVTDHLEQHFALGARAVQLDQEHALPGAQKQLAVADRHALAAAQEKLQAMRVAIRALVGVHVLGAHAEVVVAVVGVRRRELGQEAAQVLEQQRLVLLDTHRGGGVAHEHLHEAVGKAGLADDGGDMLGHVDQINGRVRLESQSGRVDDGGAHVPQPHSSARTMQMIDGSVCNLYTICTCCRQAGHAAVLRRRIRTAHGVAAVTLRAWERRYGFPRPSRARGGRRLYTERDIWTVRALRAHTEQGVPISRAIALLGDAAASSSSPHADSDAGKPSTEQEKKLASTMGN